MCVPHSTATDLGLQSRLISHHQASRTFQGIDNEFFKNQVCVRVDRPIRACEACLSMSMFRSASCHLDTHSNHVLTVEGRLNSMLIAIRAFHYPGSLQFPCNSKYYRTATLRASLQRILTDGARLTEPLPSGCDTLRT